MFGTRLWARCGVTFVVLWLLWPASAWATVMIIDDGDPSFTTTGSWTGTTAATAYGLDYHARGLGSGSNNATWTFSALPDGAQFKIGLTWFSFANRATNAPFTVSGIVGGDQTFAMNQQLLPQADLVVGATNFQYLSSGANDLLFLVDGARTVSVILTDAANGLVVADAVAIDMVPEPSAIALSILASGAMLLRRRGR